MERLRSNWINGAWVDAGGTVLPPVIDPASEEAITEVVSASPDDIDRAVAAARRTLPGWSATDIPTRSALLRRLRDAIGARTEAFAQLLAREMGSPLWLGRDFQIPMPMRNLTAMADALETMVFEEVAGTSIIWREPIGVVAAITPWNAPVHQIIAKVGGALAADCTVVLKPSEATPLTICLLVEAFETAGLPAGTVNIVFGDGTVGRVLVEHPGVAMVSFTGSVEVGRSVGAAAGRTAQGRARTGRQVGRHPDARCGLRAPFPACLDRVSPMADRSA